MLQARLPWLAAIGLWALAVGGGMTWLVAYKSTPGEAAQPPRDWPATSLARAEGKPTLVMLAHPKCVCTRASIAELRVLMSRLERDVTTYVLFVRPDGVTDEAWNDTDTWRAAKDIAGVTVLEDPRGEEAKRFGAETSGQVVLYDAEGRLLFRGGITGSRGHEGDNAGLSRALALASGQAAERDESPVFGCGLDGEERREEGGGP